MQRSCHTDDDGTEPEPAERAVDERDGEEPVESDQDGEESPVAERVRTSATELAAAEVEEALRKLEARGDLTAGQRRAVRELADGIVESLVASPARTVQAARAADDEALEAVLELFDPER